MEEIGKGLGQPKVTEMLTYLRSELDEKFLQVRREKEDLKHENYTQLV